MLNLENRHGGRFQAQGLGLEESEKWNKTTPLLITEGNALLTDLSNKLSPSDRLLRRTGFQECSIHINEVHRAGGYHNPVSKHFPKLVRPGGARVDLEVKIGSAFI
jgi:hypothetical protein